MMKLLQRFPPEMVHQVMKSQMCCDIDESFVGFIETYKQLSKLIPRTWTVVDFGCAYAPQCWYFRKHKEYIGVDWFAGKRFFTKNTEHKKMSIEDWIFQYAELMPRTTFAIANYSLSDTSIVRNNFNYCFTYYPEKDETWPIVVI